MSEGLPKVLALRSRRRIVEDAVQGLGSSRGAHISIRGGRFRLIDAKGVEKLVDTHHIECVIIDANANPARLFYGKAYEPDSDDPPVCWSDNGTGPSSMAIEPQSPTCQMCPHAMRGTAQTFSGKPTSACRNAKKVAVIIPDDPAVNVYEFQITPGSLSNFRDYCKWLQNQASGIEGRSLDVADVVTRISFDPDKQFTMLFEASAFADDEQTLEKIAYIDENHLSDAAVGRTDVACDPEMVAKMIAARPAAGQLPAPATAAPAQAPQRTLPPRTAPSAVAAPAAEPAPKKPRTRALPAAQETQAPPATNGSAGENPIPSFLRRNADNTLPAEKEAPAPKFGVGRAPPPPAEISDALSKAMSLPTRRG